LGKNQGRLGEFFRYLWLSSFQEGKFRIAANPPILLKSLANYDTMRSDKRLLKQQ
jgi:hypothetical protein